MSRCAILLVAALICGCITTSQPAVVAVPLSQSGQGELLPAGNQEFLVDKEFAALHDVVNGADNQLQQSYTRALDDYLNQADFPCQQPIYARYFDRKFAAHTMERQCRSKVPFSVITPYDGARTVWLDPERVSSIHLLFASKSKSLASRFGHVALRLVVCPEGDNSVAACDANLEEHLVVGFRAHIDEFSLNTLKALSGEYKAYLFTNHFMNVYEEYAIGEFRELYSLPLRMEAIQRQLLVRELANIHWGYGGSYRFFTRNCSTMMQNALRTIWPAFADNRSVKTDFMRPDSLFEAIRSSTLAEGFRLDSLDIAEREGYFFSSTRQFYDSALKEVKEAMTRPLFTDIDSYIQINPIKRRVEQVEDARFHHLLVSDRHLREAQIMLEEYAVLRSERMMQIEGARYFEEQNFLPKADDIQSQLDTVHAKVFDDCLLSPIRQYSSPLKRLKGIPTLEEMPAEADRISGCQTTLSRQLLHEAIVLIKNAKSEQWQRVNEISGYWSESIVNLELLKKL